MGCCVVFVLLLVCLFVFLNVRFQGLAFPHCVAKAQQKVQSGVKSVLYPWFELILLFQHQDLVLSFIFSFLLIILGGRNQIMVELAVGG